MIKLDPCHKRGISINVHMIKVIPNQTPWLLGSNLMVNGCGELKFICSESGPEPCVRFEEPFPLERYLCVRHMWNWPS
jgi:hypothetical protein